jgi:hypothetical protein
VRPSGGDLVRLFLWLSGFEPHQFVHCPGQCNVCWSVAKRHWIQAGGSRARVVLSRTVTAADKPAANTIGNCHRVCIAPFSAWEPRQWSPSNLRG